MDHAPRKPSVYDDDFFRWTAKQVELLRHGRFAEADHASIVGDMLHLAIDGKRSTS